MAKTNARTAVVTGGAGFLGSHLTDRLLSEGLKVICVDNLVTGSSDNIKHLSDRSDFTFLHHNVSSHIHIDEPVDFVFHFASPASPIDYLELPIQTLKVGSLGTHNALGLAKAKNAVFLLASTSEVYGDPQIHPQPESYWGHVNPIGPRGVYDEAKRFSEAMTMAYHRVHAVNTRIVRIFNTYGPRMRLGDGRALPAFFSQALRGKPVPVFGTGEQTRSFCFVTDLIEGIWRLANSSEHLPVNIGNPEEIRMFDIAREVIELTGNKSEIEFKELPVDDPKIRQPDITRAKEILGWEPKVNRKEGLLITSEYFKKALEQQK